MASTIITAKKFDVSKFTLADVQKNKMGGNIVYLKYDDNKKIIMQTPLMAAPFGISKYVDEKTGVVKHSIDVSFRGSDEDPKIELFQKCMSDFDEYLVDHGAKNSKAWFGKVQKKEVVEALYRPLVKPSKDPEKYAPTMKIKVPSKDDVYQVEAYKYNNGKEKFDLNNLAKGAKLQMILECASVWFVGKTQFGITWKLLQVRVQQPENIQGFSFVEDSDEEVEDEEDEELEDTIEQIDSVNISGDD